VNNYSDEPLKGFSLFEVVLAVVILSTSMAAISTLIDISRISAAQSILEVEALIRCESLIDGIILTNAPETSLVEEPFEDNPAWSYSITTEPTELETLQQITVQVTHRGKQEQYDAEVKLVRLIYIPPLSDEETL